MDNDLLENLPLRFELNPGRRAQRPVLFENQRIREFIQQLGTHNFLDRTNQDQQELHEARQNCIYYVYPLSFLPLPVINFPVVWRRLRRYSIYEMLDAAMTVVSRQLVRLGRVIWYMIIMLWWLEDVCKFISVFGSMAAFSPAFFVDISTYLFQDWTGILERKAVLFYRWGEETPIIEFETVLQMLLDSIATKVRATCNREGEYVVTCAMNHNSLIFRFSDVILKHCLFFNFLPKIFLRTVTVCFYLGYGIFAQLVGTNVLIFLSVHSAHRWFPFLQFIKSVLKLLWNHSSGLIW